MKGYKRKINNFDPYNVFLAVATNIPVRLKTGFCGQGAHLVKNVIFSYTLKNKYSLLASVRNKKKDSLQYRQYQTKTYEEQNQTELSKLCAFLVNNVVKFIQKCGLLLVHLINVSLLASVVQWRTFNIAF